MLEVAQMNLDKGFCRSACNRAYYAMFYAASALLYSKGKSLGKHSAVLAAFRQYFIKTGEFSVEVSDFYKIAFETRQIGDYERQTRFEPDILRKNLDRAREFVEEVEKWLQRHNFLST
jgi:uncharacterized protein (UPF0332 family)